MLLPSWGLSLHGSIIVEESGENDPQEGGMCDQLGFATNHEDRKAVSGMGHSCGCFRHGLYHHMVSLQTFFETFIEGGKPLFIDIYG